MHKIFISYSRHDKDKVFKIKDEIEGLIGKESCWIDLTGIESDKQFVDVIIDAIDQADIFLFMYSKYSDCSEWTRKEVEYAKSENKKIVFVKIDKVPLSKYYRFQFGGHDIIDIFDGDQKRKLMFNLLNWVKNEEVSLESKNSCDDNYGIDQNNLGRIPWKPIEVRTLGGLAKKLKHIWDRLKNVLFAFFEWLIHIKSWVILTTILNILFSFFLRLGIPKGSDVAEKLLDATIFFIICSAIPFVIVLVKPSVLGFKERVKSAFLLLIPVVVYSFSYFGLKSMEKRKEASTNNNTPKQISIYCMGDYPADSVQYLEACLRKYFPNVRIMQNNINLPPQYFNKERNRYLASGLLDELAKHRNNDAVIGVTDYIIFKPNKKSDTFGIMGMSYTNTFKSIVSTKIPLNGKKQSKNNICKLALHELGHGFGLKHCPNETCYMVDAEGTMKIVNAIGFCESCKHVLNSKGWIIK